MSNHLARGSDWSASHPSFARANHSVRDQPSPRWASAAKDMDSVQINKMYLPTYFELAGVTNILFGPCHRLLTRLFQSFQLLAARNIIQPVFEAKERPILTRNLFLNSIPTGNRIRLRMSNSHCVLGCQVHNGIWQFNPILIRHLPDYQ